MLSETAHQVALIIHRDGPIPLAELIRKMTKGRRYTNVDKGVQAMVRNGTLIEEDGLMRLSDDVFDLIDSEEQRRNKLNNTPGRLVFSKAPLDGKKMYASVLGRIRDINQKTVGVVGLTILDD